MGTPADDPRDVTAILAAIPDDALGALRTLHDDVDRASAALSGPLGARLRCGPGCADCCVDELTVFAVEAARVQRAAGALLRDGEPHPAGACAFLDGERRCRIYADRPYVCRTQGLPLRWFEEIEPGQWAEYRDVCPLNEPPATPADPPLEALDEASCWEIGPFEGRLAQLQASLDGGALRRVALRGLFVRG